MVSLIGHAHDASTTMRGRVVLLAAVDLVPTLMASHHQGRVGV
jgi:hypothetical protein